MTTFDIDSIIFIGFLIANLWFGLTSSKGITTLREYAIGDRNFNTNTIAATIIATWICGEMFLSTITETYQHGLYFIISCIFGFVISFVIIGYYFAPRMNSFLGKVSIAEVMGSLYGARVRLITSICGFIGASGIIATQLKVAGLVFQYVFNMDSAYCIITSGIIITLYSSLGGIKSVTFTDVVQCLCFFVIIPIIVYYISNSIDDTSLVLDTIKTNPNFSLDNIFDLHNTKSWYYLFIFFYALIPGFNPATFQRILMAKNTTQISNSFYISSVAILFIMLNLAWLSVVFLTKNPNLPADNIIKFLIFNECPVVYKGLLLVSIVAMVLSTADSYINSSSVLFTHDFFQSLNIKLTNELLYARIISFVIGIVGILFALKEFSLFKLAIFTASFYMPIVTVPFILAVFGYQTPYTKAVLYGMVSGLVTVLLWNYYDITIIDPIVPAMFANLTFLLFMHYYYHNKFLNSELSKKDSN